MVLRFGIEMNAWISAWFAEERDRLAAEAGSDRKAA